MSIEASDIRLETEPGGGRYVYRFPDGALAELDFVDRDAGVVVITHTGTPPQHRGKGIAAALVKRAVADFRAAGRKVVPACSYADAQFRAHPDWADLLHRG